jgi:hypothetical protein
MTSVIDLADAEVSSAAFSDRDLDELLRRLKLESVLQSWRPIVRRAELGAWSYRKFLAQLLLGARARTPGGVHLARTPADLRPVPASVAAAPVAVRGACDERPGSNAERWAIYVLRGCGSERDPKTLADWAQTAHISYTGLCESCRLLAIRPRQARDFTRVLRALLKSAGACCGPEAFLDVSDRRTLATLLAGAGGRSVAGDCEPIAVDVFLRTQQYIPVDNSGLKALALLLARSDGR